SSTSRPRLGSSPVSPRNASRPTCSGTPARWSYGDWCAASHSTVRGAGPRCTEQSVVPKRRGGHRRQRFCRDISPKTATAGAHCTTRLRILPCLSVPRLREHENALSFDCLPLSVIPLLRAHLLSSRARYHAVTKRG